MDLHLSDNLRPIQYELMIVLASGKGLVSPATGDSEETKEKQQSPSSLGLTAKRSTSRGPQLGEHSQVLGRRGSHMFLLTRRRSLGAPLTLPDEVASSRRRLVLSHECWCFHECW